jgi:hypothetical protein
LSIATENTGPVFSLVMPAFSPTDWGNYTFPGSPWKLVPGMTIGG